jgi:hypothetical protein
VGDIWGHLALAGILAMVAVGLHAYFWAHAGLATDEPTYVQAGYMYAEDVHTGHPGTILTSSYNMVHPALTKLMFAGAILVDWQVRGYAPLPTDRQYQQNESLSRFHESAAFTRYLADARLVTCLCAIFLIVLLAFYSPLAAIFALFSTVVLSFTTIAYLEAPGMLFSTLAVVLYLRGRDRGRPTRALLLAGIAIGLATAAKYYYALSGAVILVDWLFSAGRPLQQRLSSVLLLCVAALLAFGVADPIFWTQNLPGFVHELGRNGIAYSTGEGAIGAPANPNYHFHWYSNLTNLIIGFRGWYAPSQSPFLLSIDPLIAFLGGFGFVVAPRRYPLTALWLGISLVALAIYPTKYAQYTALGIVPLCLRAAVGATWLYQQYAALVDAMLVEQRQTASQRSGRWDGMRSRFSAYLRAGTKLPPHLYGLSLSFVRSQWGDAQQLISNAPSLTRRWLDVVAGAPALLRARRAIRGGPSSAHALVSSQTESDVKQ